MADHDPMAEVDDSREDAPVSGAVSEHFRYLVQQSPDLVSIYDETGRYAFASPAHRTVLGYEPEELIGHFPLDFLHPDEVESVAIEFAEQLSGVRPPAPVEMRFRCRDGSYRELEAVAVDLTDEPAVGGVYVTARDVSARRRAEEVVKDQAAILERIARGAPLSDTLAALCEAVERWVRGSVAVVLVTEGSPPVLRIRSAPSLPEPVRAVTDGAKAPALGSGIRKGVFVAPIESEPPSPVADAAYRAAGLRGWWGAPVFASDGERVLGVVALLLPELRDPEPVEAQLLTTAGSLAAIAIERDQVQAQLRHQASHDILTGLPNRDQLVEWLGELPRAAGPGSHAAVFFLDLDRFKVFNDSVGHGAGDRILIELGHRLRSALRDGDAVARFGGDEFVVACAGLDSPEEIMTVARRLLDVVSRPFLVDDAEFVVSASVGVALVDGRPPEELLRDADAAMYQAKERGRARIEVFDDQIRAKVVARLQTERELRRAIEIGELTVHYQPVIALETHQLAGFEALVRWEHPERGLLSPDAFLDVAEEASLIARIGSFTRAEACRQWTQWRRDHPEWGDCILAVNLAAAELRDAALPAHVANLLSDAGVEPHLLVFETSERALADDTEAARAVLTELHALGVLLALDDFGTGSSPLLHLREFPIDAVKLDGALVAGLGVNREDDVIVDSVISLAHRLGLYVVAEGVEGLDQVARLRSSGCLLAQGHAFAPAMSASEVEQWVFSRAPDTTTDERPS
jgi:diguanylate cyclase (GGDEF)-like protein/PAS domain S-box-containing protein